VKTTISLSKADDRRNTATARLSRTSTKGLTRHKLRFRLRGTDVGAGLCLRPNQSPFSMAQVFARHST
jgi:hypothetical protein